MMVKLEWSRQVIANEDIAIDANADIAIAIAIYAGPALLVIVW